MKRLMVVLALAVMVIFAFAAFAIVLPVPAMAEEGGGLKLGLNWETALTIASVVITLLAAGAWVKLKAALGATKAILNYLVEALADDRIDNEELTELSKRLKAGGLSWKEFGQAVVALFRKSSSTA